jgi:hypothetical protein
MSAPRLRVRLADHGHLAEALAGGQQIKDHAVLEHLQFAFGEEVETIADVAVDE